MSAIIIKRFESLDIENHCSKCNDTTASNSSFLSRHAPLDRVEQQQKHHQRRHNGGNDDDNDWMSSQESGLNLNHDDDDGDDDDDDDDKKHPHQHRRPNRSDMFSRGSLANEGRPAMT